MKHYILLLLAEKDIVTNVSPLNQAQKSFEGYNDNIKILQSRISKIATTSGQRKKNHLDVEKMIKAHCVH
jgi:hypothetical protein